jgi:hypothetical protein
MAAGLSYGLQDSIWVMIRRTVSEPLINCRDEERAGMLPSMAAGLLYRLQDSVLGPDPQDCI